MSDFKSTTSRRKLLKSIAAGSGAVAAGNSLPESWSKPVINAIVLPAHAALTDDTGLLGSGVTPAPRVCCEGVFCELRFGGPIGGSAQVNSDCTITMDGGSRGGNWSGSGTVEADGSFSFSVIFSGILRGPILNTTTPSPTTAAPQIQRLVTGSVAADCSTISGSMESWGAFSGTVTPGATSLSFCKR